MTHLPYKAYSLNNFRQIPQLARLSEEQMFDIQVVGNVLPFKTNSYVIEELIDWDRVPDDPIFRLTFPQRGMLRPEHFDEVAGLIRGGADAATLKPAVQRIRMQLNPHPAGQMAHNIPTLESESLDGMQHKYRETVLFFPSQGQTCHAYCTFCFRWPQFVGMSDLKFASREVDKLVRYLEIHPEVSDVLITGGDPMIMSAKHLAAYVEPLLAANLPNLRHIRIGTKALTFWPYRFIDDADSGEILDIFRRVARSGHHLALMAHFNHPQEMRTPALAEAVANIRETGAVIRTQSPLLAHINDDAGAWATMWDKQVDLGMVPYYMFVARDTGAQHYFAVPLVKAQEIFREAYKRVSGLCRTVRGPSMSAGPGKIQMLGVSEVNGQKLMTLRFLQGRNPDWVQRPFFARYDPEAAWLDDLRPAFGESKFFFEEELEALYASQGSKEEDEPVEAW